MRHLNGNILAAVLINTTGPAPFHHDLAEIAVIPLISDYRVSPTQAPFHCYIKPGRPHNIEKATVGVKASTLAKCNMHGLDSYDSAEAFLRWFENLKLNFGKKIMPLSYRFHLLSPFLMDWLKGDFHRVFSENVRDICCMSLTANDRAVLKGIEYPYQKQDLGYLQSKCGYPGNDCEDCLERCISVLETYRVMIRSYY